VTPREYLEAQIRQALARRDDKHIACGTNRAANDHAFVLEILRAADFYAAGEDPPPDRRTRWWLTKQGERALGYEPPQEARR
jgi:hypothetical protein